MSAKNRLSPPLYFSYNQFMVFDASVSLPGCAWEELHSAQGFARRESTVCFNSLLEFGHANVTVIHGPYEAKESYERVIAVPFCAKTSTVIVEGPEEFKTERMVTLEPGNYRLVAAQQVIDEDNEVIDLFFEPLEESLNRSEILVADEVLTPPDTLMETSEIAGD